MKTKNTGNKREKVRINSYPVWTQLTIFLYLILFIEVSTACAKELFVSPVGNDNVSYSENSFKRPWATPAKAYNNAMAGDIVYFREGIYIIKQRIGYKYKGNNGTLKNPIVFTIYKDEMVTFQADNIVVFEVVRNYHVYDGFRCIGGLRFFSLGSKGSAIGCVVKNCTFSNLIGGDNYAYVMIGKGAVGATVENCKMAGPGLFSEGVHVSTKGILVWRTEGIKILRNEISNIPSGIIYKHANPQRDSGIEIAYNYIHDTDGYAMELNCNYAKIHHNLIGQNNRTVKINMTNGGPGGDYNIFSNNTFYDASVNFAIYNDDKSELPGALYNTIKNNIFTRQVWFHAYLISVDPHIASDYNLFMPGDRAIRKFNSEYSLSNWPDAGPHDIAGTPMFVGDSSPTTVSDFALKPGSIGKGAGKDGCDMGADVNQLATSKLPNPPRGLRIIHN